MATSYVIISNTGSIGDGKRLIVKAHTWRVSREGAETFVGLDGSASQGVGAVIGKTRIEFTGRAQKVGATNYTSLDGSGQTVINWAATTTAALRLLKVTDVYGTTRDMLWDSGYEPAPLNDDIDGNSEWYEFPVRLVEQ